MWDEIYGVSRIIRGTIVSRFEPADTSLVSPSLLLSYSFRCIIASLRIESTPLLSLSLYRDLKPVFVARGRRLDR